MCINAEANLYVCCGKIKIAEKWNGLNVSFKILIGINSNANDFFITFRIVLKWPKKEKILINVFNKPDCIFPIDILTDN